MLNHAQPIPGFVYEPMDFLKLDGQARIDVVLRARDQGRGKCGDCWQPCPGYDRQRVRDWPQVPVWNLAVHCYYAPRRVSCPTHGIVVEHLPWSAGKRRCTVGFMTILARWAQRLSWLETACAFKVSWEAVFRSVEWMVAWGRQHRDGAVDEVRRGEMARLHQAGRSQRTQLKRMRWNLLKKGSRVRGPARQRLNTLLASKLATARAWLLKEAFQHFGIYRSVRCAGAFPEQWCQRAMRSRLAPMKKVARMLRRHQPPILNWFRAKGELSSRPVEGLNNKIRVTTKRAYAYRTFRSLAVSLYPPLGKPPQPPPTHRFC